MGFWGTGKTFRPCHNPMDSHGCECAQTQRVKITFWARPGLCTIYKLTQSPSHTKYYAKLAQKETEALAQSHTATISARTVSVQSVHSYSLLKAAMLQTVDNNLRPRMLKVQFVGPCTHTSV